MINDFAQKRYGELEEELALLTAVGTTPVKRVTEIIKAIRRALEQVRVFLTKNQFVDKNEEILFFKHIKPGFCALHIYYLDYYKIEADSPAGGKEATQRYYELQLEQVERFFSRYALEYQYEQLGLTALDEEFFIRGAASEESLFAENPNQDPLFSTSHDYLFAKIRAYRMLRERLAELINGKNEVASIVKNPPVQKRTTLLNLSVDQIGLLARAADNAHLITGTSFSRICQDLAPYLATPEKDPISAASMRSNAYTGEDVDKQVVIRYLEKMIRLIKEY